jgi:hypothetical protein
MSFFGPNVRTTIRTLLALFGKKHMPIFETFVAESFIIANLLSPNRQLRKPGTHHRHLLELCCRHRSHVMINAANSWKRQPQKLH